MIHIKNGRMKKRINLQLHQKRTKGGQTSPAIPLSPACETSDAGKLSE